ncbi:MAG: ABC transporter permease [Planctomycetes bacterium]|nr:ABC transporter permease [Planctomycetota bacterium]
MNSHTAKALILDAFYQVLDNKIFRLLVLVAICLIAPTFLIAFKPNEIDVLFGWKTLAYTDIGPLSSVAGTTGQDLSVLAIQTLQTLFIEGLAGTFGIMFSLAATAFFVPRMLEKGEADTLFSKPTGRFVLLIARYASGVLFVGVLAFILVLGMHLGLLLRSGYSDPGFLWGALTLVYIFALIHAFSTLVGVLTRSSVTALLVSILFFAFNGCVNQLWIGKEHAVAEARESSEEDEAGAAARLEGMEHPLVRFLYGTLDTLHYVLPKTGDGDVLTRQLRRAIDGPEFVLEDPIGQLSFVAEPVGLKRPSTAKQVDMGTDPVVWTNPTPENGTAQITASRKSRVFERTTGERVRKLRLSGTAAVNEFMRSLEARSDLEGKPEKTRDTTDRLVRDWVKWSERRAGAVIHRERGFYVISDWLYTFDLECDELWRRDEKRADVLREFLAGAKPQRDRASDLQAVEWYEKRFGWTSPLRFNAFFSLGSSVAFALIMLLLARWRLSRIDF